MVVEKLDQILSLLREQRNMGRSRSKRLTLVKQKNRTVSTPKQNVCYFYLLYI